VNFSVSFLSNIFWVQNLKKYDLFPSLALLLARVSLFFSSSACYFRRSSRCKRTDARATRFVFSVLSFFTDTLKLQTVRRSKLLFKNKALSIEITNTHMRDIQFKSKEKRREARCSDDDEKDDEKDENDSSGRRGCEEKERAVIVVADCCVRISS